MRPAAGGLTVKDTHDDPYLVQRRPFVLPCAECGAVERVIALRNAEGGTANTPAEPLCADCAGIWSRVWAGRLSAMSPPPEDTWLDEGGQRFYVVLCPRCGGTGAVLGGLCFACIGMRWVALDAAGVRRTARWWETYQQNRT
jgi:hypothetical protein